MIGIPNLLLIIPVGAVIGILVAAPVGPVNVLCIQRAISRGFWGGVAAGTGAVLGDGLIAFSAAMGVNVISDMVKTYRIAIQLVGGLAVMVFGASLFFTKPKRIDREATARDANARFFDFVWDVPKTFFLTITNPGAVLGLFAIFAGVSTFVEISTNFEALVMVAAIMGGSFGWWMILSHLIGRIRHRIDEQRLALINQIGGIILIAFGALMLGELAYQWLQGTLTAPAA
ncbi:MAG: LysE family transporter [Pseudomonadota bacterium]